VALLAALTFNGLHGVTSQKAVFFITTAVITSNPIYYVTTGSTKKCKGLSIYSFHTKRSHYKQSNQLKVPLRFVRMDRKVTFMNSELPAKVWLGDSEASTV
jgi:hypothetical protein